MANAPAASDTRVEPADLESYEPIPEQSLLESAFESVRSLCMALTESELRHPTVDAQLAFTNAMTGHRLLKPHYEFVQELPRFDFDLVERIPELAQSLLWINSQMRVVVEEPDDRPEKLARMRQLRRALLSHAEGAAALNLVPEEPLILIAKGSGVFDAARDCVDLVGFYRKHPKPLMSAYITSSLLMEAEALAIEVMNEYRPSNAADGGTRPPLSIAELTVLRNRVWVMLHRGHAEASRAAAYLGLAFPSLGSRQGYKRMPPKVPEAVPASGVSEG